MTASTLVMLIFIPTDKIGNLHFNTPKLRSIQFLVRTIDSLYNGSPRINGNDNFVNINGLIGYPLSAVRRLSPISPL